jgi:hypothetical protein
LTKVYVRKYRNTVATFSDGLVKYHCRNQQRAMPTLAKMTPRLIKLAQRTSKICSIIGSKAGMPSLPKAVKRVRLSYPASKQFEITKLLLIQQKIFDVSHKPQSSPNQIVFVPAIVC